MIVGQVWEMEDGSRWSVTAPGTITRVAANPPEELSITDEQLTADAVLTSVQPGQIYNNLETGESVTIHHLFRGTIWAVRDFLDNERLFTEQYLGTYFALAV